MSRFIRVLQVSSIGVLMLVLSLHSIGFASAVTMPLVIDSVELLDANGNAATSFGRGRLMFVRITLKEDPDAGSYAAFIYQVVVRIQDPDGFFVTFSSSKETWIPGGTKQVTFGFMIPYQQLIAGTTVFDKGTYNLKAFVIDNFPWALIGSTTLATNSPVTKTFTVPT